ncbi:MAG: acetyltransferase [Desulfobulbaceae bacterium]|nr:acetyltransferase [Desulfobulbaceae bacterium]
MIYFDVFNGDADGICALHQLRMANPSPEAKLVTGVKRDIKLLAKLKDISQASVTVLDISMDSNRVELDGLLASGCSVFYVDHHFAGDIPGVETLTAHIDPSPEVCTSLIVDRLLGGRYRMWAVAAAFGDNLHESARKAASSLGLTPSQMATLCELGELLNYNGYGRTIDDLHISPEDLYMAVHEYEDPFEFCRQSAILALLRQGFADDMTKAREGEPLLVGSVGRVYRFPAEPWTRRVAGVFSNEKAREREDLAHALLVDNNDGTFTVSVRAPLVNKKGADTLCRCFPTGGGRAGAAGINQLPDDLVDKFIRDFEEVFTS